MKNKKILLILLIIIIGTIIRFYKSYENFYFTMDEERDAFIFARVFKEGHIPLIGGSIPGGLYVGPIYTWISSFLLFSVRYDYARLGFFAGLISSVSLIFLYLSTKKIFNEKIAIITLAIYSFSYLSVQFNKRYFPPTLACSWLIFVLYAISIFNVHRKRSLLIIIFSLIVGIQSDPSNTALFLGVMIYFFLIQKNKFSGILIAFCVTLSHLPLLIFDLRHNFFLFKAIMKFFSLQKNETGVHIGNLLKVITGTGNIFIRNLFIFGNPDLARQFPPEPQSLVIERTYPPAISTLGFLLVCLGIILLLKRFKNKEARMPLVLIFITIIGIGVYNLFFPGYISEWFFTGSLPLLALLSAVILYRLPKYATIAFLCIFSIFNLHQNFKVVNSFSYQKKLNILTWAKKYLKNKPYELISLGKIHKYGGYRYLTELLQFKPVKSDMDIYYEWLYPQKIPKIKPQMMLYVSNMSEIDKNILGELSSKLKKRTVFQDTIWPLKVIIVEK